LYNVRGPAHPATKRSVPVAMRKQAGLEITVFHQVP
jgi:hypothetical protein